MPAEAEANHRPTHPTIDAEAGPFVSFVLDHLSSRKMILTLFHIGFIYRLYVRSKETRPIFPAVPRPCPRRARSVALTLRCARSDLRSGGTKLSRSLATLGVYKLLGVVQNINASRLCFDRSRSSEAVANRSRLRSHSGSLFPLSLLRQILWRVPAPSVRVLSSPGSREPGRFSLSRPPSRGC